MKNIKFLGLAALAMVFTVACNNNKAAEEDTTVCDTTIDMVLDTTIEAEAVDTTAVVAEAPVAKKTTAKKEEAAPKNVTKKATLTKTDAKEVASELKATEEKSVTTAEQNLGKRKSAKEAFKKN
ncbi:MAG: hypothetical protein IJQ14_05460 [Bacteroidales bacterium]|nr:hypothetical protein [Bacteroidales bacterium]